MAISARISSTLASTLAMTAALSMATPAMAAADLGQPVSYGGIATPDVAANPVWDSESENADRYRRYRRNRGVDAGDVIAGVLVLGTIAAIAGAASSNRNRDRDRRYRTRDYRSNESSELNRAVNNCVGTIERDVRVDSVDNVSRVGNGWRISGSLYNGESFTCRAGNNGRVDGVDYGRAFEGAGYQGGGAPSTSDRQWSDDRYAAARQSANQGTPSTGSYSVQPSTSAEGVAAYPGGPINGDAYQVDLPEGSSGTYSAPRESEFGG